jgi:hypothetical protein
MNEVAQLAIVINDRAGIYDSPTTNGNARSDYRAGHHDATLRKSHICGNEGTRTHERLHNS